MCGIVGLVGNFKKELLFSMIESIKHRGIDSSGFYLFNNDLNKSILENNFDLKSLSESKDHTINNNSLENKELFNIGLGHNLLSIFNIINENNEIYDNLEENRQPILINNLVLVFNGEIYNFNKLESFLKENNYYDNKKINYLGSKSDSRLLANLINFYYQKFYQSNFKLNNKNNNSNLTSEVNENNKEILFNSVKEVIKQLNGDYSFAVYDTKNNDLIICRDSIGVKPLYYGVSNSIKGFASEKKALWKIGIKDKDIKDLKPGSILYNWKPIDLEDDLINKIIATDFKSLKEKYSNNYKTYLEEKDSYEVYKELLIYDLYSSVEKRVENLSEVALIFSGGVDSSILALILKEISQKREKLINSTQYIKPFTKSFTKSLNVKLYAVGLKNSQDIKFSKKIAKELDLPLKTIIINEDIIKDAVPHVLRAIEDTNIMKLGVGMTIYLASKAINEDGIKVAISGQGADELFGGYNRYLKHFDNNSLYDAYFDLDEEIYHDIANMYHVNLERDDAVAMANSVELRVPFLDKDLINLALDIPAKYKIKDNDDILRKHILRDLAKDIGLKDYIADRPKKAAQYGSGINKILKKKVLKDFNLDKFLESFKRF